MTQQCTGNNFFNFFYKILTTVFKEKRISERKEIQLVINQHIFSPYKNEPFNEKLNESENAAPVHFKFTFD